MLMALHEHAFCTLGGRRDCPMNQTKHRQGAMLMALHEHGFCTREDVIRRVGTAHHKSFLELRWWAMPTLLAEKNRELRFRL
jgi:hypothetical protein